MQAAPQIPEEVARAWNRCHGAFYQVSESDLLWNLREQRLVRYWRGDLEGVPMLWAEAAPEGAELAVAAKGLWLSLFGEIPAGEESEFAAKAEDYARQIGKARLAIGSDEFHFLPGIPADEPAGARLTEAFKRRGFNAADCADFLGDPGSPACRAYCDAAAADAERRGWTLRLVESDQKMIIHKCNVAGVPVILATQMLESMIDHARPTRAEASDVANAIFDGADALMLSAETASGKFPAQTVQIMTDIIKQAEKDRESLKVRKPAEPPIISIPDAIEHAAAQVAVETGAKAIVCVTNSGKAAQAISKFRPKVPVFAITDRKEVLQRLALIWGVKGVLIPKVVPEVDALTMAERVVVGWWNKYLVPALKPLQKGDLLVMTIGIPTMVRAKTNTVTAHVIKGR